MLIADWEYPSDLCRIAGLSDGVDALLYRRQYSSAFMMDITSATSDLSGRFTHQNRNLRLHKATQAQLENLELTNIAGMA